MDTAKLLLEFSALNGVAGRESGLADYAAGLLSPYGEVSVTPLGSVLCAVRPARADEPRLLLDAHMDEIGMMVTHIEDSGFLRVAPCGGIDRRILAAAPVTVHTRTGPVTGVVVSTPPHLASDGEKKNPKVEDIYIDVGLIGKDAKSGISPGDTVVTQSSPRELMNGLVSGRALDDRAGCVSLLKALEELRGAELNCGLTVMFSSMEEVGGAGAKTAAYTVNPTDAIVVDVSFAHTPDARKDKCGELKKGPMIGAAPILDRRMTDALLLTAKVNEIPFQIEVMGGRTGTNADHIAVSRGGVRTALISIPQKYMHTPIEAVAVCDVEDTGRLIAAYIISSFGGARNGNS